LAEPTEDAEIRFTEWWSRVEPEILLLARSFVGSDAEDIAQEVAFAAFARMETFADSCHFRRCVPILKEIRQMMQDFYNFRRDIREPQPGNNLNH